VHDAIAVAIMLIGNLFDTFAAAALHIANGHELDILFRKHHAQVILAARAEAEAAQHNPFAWGHGASAAQGSRRNEPRHGQGARAGKGAPQEIAPGKVFRAWAILHALLQMLTMQS